MVAESARTVTRRVAFLQTLPSLASQAGTVADELAQTAAESASKHTPAFFWSLATLGCARSLQSLTTRHHVQRSRLLVPFAAVAIPFAYLRHSPDIPQQAIIGAAGATGVLTAIALAKRNKVGRFRKAIYLVRQPVLQMGVTMLLVHPQFVAQQCGLRTHK